MFFVLKERNEYDASKKGEYSLIKKKNEMI
jgi:hypothetical protein